MVARDVTLYLFKTAVAENQGGESGAPVGVAGDEKNWKQSNVLCGIILIIATVITAIFSGTVTERGRLPTNSGLSEIFLLARKISV